jgi:oxygen-independent coproporphyrinogen-3 oxidase
MSVAGSADALGGDEDVEASRLPFEYMLNALRLHEGFALSDFEARTGLPRATIAAELGDAVSRGWLDVDGERVVPTALGRRLGNDVVSLFLA